MESFWALLRRGYDGAFHHLSKKRLHRYANKFTGRLHARVLDMMVRSVVGKRLTYSQLVQVYLYNQLCVTLKNESKFNYALAGSGCCHRSYDD